ncbi:MULTISPECIES: NADPH-dependent F420 reductase [unclassified Curtobacterium]|uniref:NADPH-dependent F420 reductase n=1 Tax=unclassified Curtobacterium TaxID=257496 RepID=UPI000DA89831|nr:MULTISPECIES: NAD(P)-binding domain-containing protein [unclassified Curtobacterium]PZE23434.1 diguanylate cyclase [Curtobacterium sp. MCBD17_028]PZF55345.1 diguanylate cyclase [Curtobacterium sp. MCBD17_034]PZM32811.1 diguanylate cyclase [Curtobacterium sp. MCBD17_031]WIB63568.1 NAD(P)-binding domain-containing protein [Curtobacterium sp. MCBD17_040]WIB67407.1 NAD(P)-binding domain-containing protein [Curtobacterium sp. MCBD17_035]
MTSISILGTGNMGTAIASVFSDGGATVESIKHSDEPTSFAGDIVVLAVPYAALPEIADKYKAALGGKTVVDITNTVDFATFQPVAFDAGSGAADLAARLPESRVVKAFNTNFASALAAKSVGGKKTAVLIAGDDADAKAALREAITAGGLDAYDAGPLARAHELEGIGYLQMGLAVSEQIGWTDGLGVIK